MTFDWFHNSPPRQGRRLVWDTETNGLLPPDGNVSKLHCLCIKDIDTAEIWSCGSDPLCEYTLEFGLELLREAGMVVAHNGLAYDYPVLRYLRSGWDTEALQRDTLILCKMLWPVDKLKDLDYPRWRKSKALEERGLPPTFPGKLIGAQALEAWGYRMGKMKGEYSATVKAWSKKLKANEVSLKDIPQDFHCLLTDANELDPWKAWNKPMQDYCVQDVEVTFALFKLIESHLDGSSPQAKGIAWSPQAVDLEHRMWMNCIEQQERGFGFDHEGAIKLTKDLKNRQALLARDLKQAFGSWWAPGPVTTPARSFQRTHLDDNNEPFPDVTIVRLGVNGKELKPYVGPPKASFSEDAPFTPIVRTEFNPKSRQHLGERLQAVFGWQPIDWVGANADQAKVDETIIKEMEESILPAALRETILEYLVVTKTLGQLADGRKSWVSLCNMDDLRLHGRVDPLGTVSNRGAHTNPNLGQVPGVSVNETKDDDGKVISKEVIWGWKGGFGAECRSLFRPGIRTALGKEGFKCQTGIDASGLQLRCLGARLAQYDGGAFARRVSTPGLDIHHENGKLCGLGRSQTKKVTYTWLFGAGPPKIGITVGLEDGEIDLYADSPAAKSYLSFMRRILKEPNLTYDRKHMAYIGKGSELAKKFVNGIDGLKDLKEGIKHEAETYGFILGLDGRKLHIRKPHAALNQALQGDEAIICKAWGLEMEVLLKAEGLQPDRDFGQMAWVHDEYQFEHRDGLQATIAEVGQRAMNNVEAMYDFKCPLGSEAKSGANWFDCH
jgi:DNA polymerase-1